MVGVHCTYKKMRKVFDNAGSRKSLVLLKAFVNVTMQCHQLFLILDNTDTKVLNKSRAPDVGPTAE